MKILCYKTSLFHFSNDKQLELVPLIIFNLHKKFRTYVGPVKILFCSFALFNAIYFYSVATYSTIHSMFAIVDPFMMFVLNDSNIQSVRKKAEPA